MQVIYETFPTRPLNDFFAELQFEFPDLPYQLFAYYLLRTARTMAKQGNLIQRRVIIDAHQNVTRYRLESPDGMEICGILDIRSMPPCSCSSSIVSRSFAAPEGAGCCARDVAWYDSIENVLNINPPYCHGRYYIRVSVAPTLNACELPDKFYTDYLQTLNVGTKAAILVLTGRPWTNINLGQSYQKEFHNLLRDDAVENMTNKMRGAVKINFGRVL